MLYTTKIKGAAMTFVFDLDDTVCDTDGFSVKYIEQFSKEYKMNLNRIQAQTRFAEAKFDWKSEYANWWYKVYGDEMMLQFPCKEGAVETINTLYDMGHRIIIATARATDWHTTPVAVTKLWLAKNKIKYTKLYTGRVDKEKICEAENADFFVDDDLKITKAVAQHFQNSPRPCQAVLMTSDFNKDFSPADGVVRATDFAALKQIIGMETLFDENGI